MKRLLSCILLSAALCAGGPLHAQTAGETSIGLSMDFGPRMGLTLSAKTFVADQVAVRCTLSALIFHYAVGCGVQRYGVLGERTFVGVDLGRTSVFGHAPRPQPGTPPHGPERFVFASATAGIQARPATLEEFRPYVAVGPAVAIGPGAALFAFLQGLPATGTVQPLYVIDAGLEFYPISH